jgi:hypothetical protein
MYKNTKFAQFHCKITIVYCGPINYTISAFLFKLEKYEVTLQQGDALHYLFKIRATRT